MTEDKYTPAGLPKLQREMLNTKIAELGREGIDYDKEFDRIAETDEMLGKILYQFIDRSFKRKMEAERMLAMLEKDTSQDLTAFYDLIETNFKESAQSLVEMYKLLEAQSEIYGLEEAMEHTPVCRPVLEEDTIRAKIREIEREGEDE